ncbi:39S ribosomal protein L27, mitochondrial [Sigmodon hispidus]
MIHRGTEEVHPIGVPPEQCFVFSALTALLSPKTATALAVRCASKKTGGSSKNLGGKSRGKHYGIKKMEGHYVHAGNILGTQRQFRWHPGAHVGLGKNKCLYALEEGIVRYTKDVYVPNPKNSEAVDLVTNLPKGAVLYKTFVHVVPAKPEGTFRLIPEAAVWVFANDSTLTSGTRQPQVLLSALTVFLCCQWGSVFQGTPGRRHGSQLALMPCVF